MQPEKATSDCCSTVHFSPSQFVQHDFQFRNWKSCWIQLDPAGTRNHFIPSQAAHQPMHSDRVLHHTPTITGTDMVSQEQSHYAGS